MNNNHEHIITINRPYTEGYNKPYNGENKEECSICLDNNEFTYKSWVKLGCNHYFHRHCIDLWLEQRQTCPICVQNIYNTNSTKNIWSILGVLCCCVLIILIGLIFSKIN